MLEICVEDVESVHAALEGGADRLEVCSALALGGLTPSAALVEHAVRRGARVRAMIRPRPGGFDHSGAELAMMERDIAAMLDAGAEGVVVGVADAAGELDEAATGRLLDRARRRGGEGVGLTLHRVIDLVADPVATVAQAARLGFDCVLSSGGALKALEGAQMLARMHKAAPAGLVVMAGSGVTPQTAPAILARSGVAALHGTARGRPRAAACRLVEFGFAPTMQATTSAETVRALKRVMAERR